MKHSFSKPFLDKKLKRNEPQNKICGVHEHICVSSCECVHVGMNVCFCVNECVSCVHECM